MMPFIQLSAPQTLLLCGSRQVRTTKKKEAYKVFVFALDIVALFTFKVFTTLT